MQTNPTKQKVVETAIGLFFQKGFHGTSVRDIAERADVNVSLISYYFQGKQGLLEYVVTDYYEQYLAYLEASLMDNDDVTALDKIKNLLFNVLDYKTKHLQLTTFIQRELSLDSIFVREMTVTYLAKENYLIKKLFTDAIDESNGMRQNYLLMQLKGMLMSPYIVKNETNNQILDEQMREQFVLRYSELINEWLDFLMIEK